MTTSSDDILAGLLAECSDLILAGATVRSCLDHYPEHVAALEPLLTTLAEVHEMRAVPVRSAAAAAQTREQFMTAAVRLSAEQQQAPATWWERLAAWWAGFVALLTPPAGGWSLPRGMPVGLLATMIIVILAGVLVTGGVTVSAKSLPGDFLYPIKTTTERVQLFITRDPAARNILEQKLSGRRIQEAKAVAEQGRTLASLPLDGTIEAINGDNWTVSGLNVTLDPSVQILGNPALGARVRGVMRAPGDGRLIVFYVEVEAPTTGLVSAAAAANPTATPTRRAPTATPSFTPTATATADALAADSALNRPVQHWREPDDWTPAAPTATPTAIPVRTATRTPRPTRLPTLTPAPTSTLHPDLPPARPQITLRIEGWVERIEGSRWIIDGTPVNTNGATQIIGNPGVGWEVSALVVQETDGSYTALQIAALAPPEATPAPVEFTDILESMDGEWWTIGGTRVKIRGDTAIVGDPQVGDLVKMTGKRHQSEIWAERIERIFPLFEFGGIISAVSGSSIVVDGYTVLIDSQTEIIGTPEVGRVAEVRAEKMDDGRLIGKKIVVGPPLPPPTVTATRQPTPTPTSTPSPTPTPTSEPTSTATPEPTPTPTSEPTATVTPEPTSTPTSEPTATVTPEPTSTPTSEPTSTTVTPEATPSPTLEPASVRNVGADGLTESCAVNRAVR